MNVTDETVEALAPREGGGRMARRFGPIAVLVLGFVLFFALGLHNYVSFSSLRSHHDELVGFVGANALSASLIFIGVYALAVALSVPGAALLTITGGLLFGVVWGVVLVVIGATAGAILVFLAARTALGDILYERAGPWIRKLEDGFRADAFNYLLTLRLIPIVPFWLVNLVPAFFGVSLPVFAIATVIGIVPGTIVFVSVGNGLGATLEDPDLSIIFDPVFLLPILGLAALSLLPVVYKRVVARRRGSERG